MKFKKIDFTDFVVKGTEWFSSLALLNICWLLFSLPLVTLIPATDAVFTVIYEWEQVGRPAQVFQRFNQAFKAHFKRSFKLGLPLLLILIVVTVDIYYLNQVTLNAAWFQIVKYAFYTFTFLLTIAILYAYPLTKQTGEDHIRVFVLGLLMAVGHPLITLGVIGSLIVLLIIFALWPGMLFFFGLTAMAWLMTKVVAHIMEKTYT